MLEASSKIPHIVSAEEKKINVYYCSYYIKVIRLEREMSPILKIKATPI